MKSRMILPAILAVGLFCLVSTSSAQAGLFGHNSGCGCEPTCGVEPACGYEASCDPCCAPQRVGLLARLRAKCAAKSACCEPAYGCEAPCEPTCGAEPACGCEPACDPCCAPKRVGLLARLRAKCAAKSACCEPTCGVEPSCGCN